MLNVHEAAPTGSPATRAVPAAAVWLNGRQAIVARTSLDGHLSTCEVTRGTEPEPSYLALVVRAIGDRDRVLIMGPTSLRLALEREYVAIHKRPDRLVDVEPSDAIRLDQLIGRLREFAG